MTRWPPHLSMGRVTALHWHAETRTTHTHMHLHTLYVSTHTAQYTVYTHCIHCLASHTICINGFIIRNVACVTWSLNWFSCVAKMSDYSHHRDHDRGGPGVASEAVSSSIHGLASLPSTIQPRLGLEHWSSIHWVFAGDKTRVKTAPSWSRLQAGAAAVWTQVDCRCLLVGFVPTPSFPSVMCCI